LTKSAIPCKRSEVREEPAHIIEAMRPVGMTCDLDLLPRGQLPIGFAQRVLRPLLEPGNFVSNVDCLAALGKLLQFENLAFEVGNGFFEIEIVEHSPCRVRRMVGARMPRKFAMRGRKR